MAVCLNHTDTEAATRCAACGKPICEKCIVAGKYCSEACHQNGIKAGSLSSDVLEKKRRAGKKSALRNFIVFIIVIVLAALAFHFYKQNKRAIDSRVNYELNNAKKALNKVEKAGHQSIDKESKYKRDRENLVK